MLNRFYVQYVQSYGVCFFFIFSFLFVASAQELEKLKAELEQAKKDVAKPKQDESGGSELAFSLDLDISDSLRTLISTLSKKGSQQQGPQKPRRVT